jgi:flagellar biogenesis protein FliO
MEEQKNESMEEKQAENVEQQEPAKKERPTFLTVLCILSFIGVGIVVISSLVGLLAGKAGSMIMEAAESVEGMQDIPEMEPVSNAVRYASTLSAINLICALIVLVGVIMMWNLKKLGYYIYVPAEIAPVIFGFILIGGGMFGGLFAALSAIFPILFIILYGLNVKHMT